MNLFQRHAQIATRRHFLKTCQVGLGSIALGSLASNNARPAYAATSAADPLALKHPPRVAKAKHVIYLHMSGSPPQHDLFDNKPKLVELNMKPCPDSLMKDQRFPFIKGHPNLLGTVWKFKQYGQGGTWVSELLPHFTEIVDEAAVVR